jgi:hypothetical protein
VTATAGADANKALIAKAFSATQSANIFEIQNSGGTAIAAFVPTSATFKINGGLVAGGVNAATTGVLNGYTTSASGIGLFVKASASQTADLIQTQTSAGVVLGGRNAVGQIYTGSTSASKLGQNTTIALTSATGSAGVVTYTSNNASATQPFIAGATVLIGAGLTGGTPSGGFASVTAVIQSVGGSTGAWTFAIANATTGTSTGGTSQAKLSANLAVTATTFATTPIVVQGASSQAANLQEWQDSTGAALALVDNGGGMRASGYNNIASYLNSRLQLTTTGAVFDVGVATNKVLTVKGAALQSANIQEWQDSTGTALAAVRSDGKLKFATGNTATTVGATGAASALPALPVGYVQIDVNGTLYKMPYYNN